MRFRDVSEHLQVVAMSDRPPLDAELEARVQAVWEAEVEHQGGFLFNGRLFSIDELAPDRMTGVFVEYRWLVAQRRRPDLFERLRIRPLAVSGMVESPDGLIFGRRGRHMATDAGKWELAPSGGLDPDTCLRRGTVDYMRQFYHELEEELGIEWTQIATTRTFLLVEDVATHVFDLVIAARTALRAQQIHQAFLRTRREYSEVKLVPMSGIARFVSKQNSDIVPVTAELLAYRKLIASR